MNVRITILVALLTTVISGCGTLQCCSTDDMEAWSIYGGVACDVKEIQYNGSEFVPGGQTPLMVVARACDLPLSAAADTLLLPVTVTYAIAKGLDRADEASPFTREALERFQTIEPPQQPAIPAK
jgi:uncharacterized protein YceK